MLDLLECKDGSCYFNTQKVEFTYPPQKTKTKQKNPKTQNPKPNQNKTKNYDGVETRKKLASYENIKFYDYIP